MKKGVRPSTGIITVTVGTPHGERTVSTGTTDPKLANQIIKAANVNAIEVLSKAGKLSQKLFHKLTVGGNKTVQSAIEEWETWLRSTCGSDRTADNHVLYVRAWARDANVAGMKVADVEEQHIAKWVNTDDGTKLSSKRIKLTAVRQFFKFCSIRDYSSDPSRLVKVKARQLPHESKEITVRECFTDEEVEKIIRHLKTRLEELSKYRPAADEKHRHQQKISTLRFWLSATIIGRYAGLRLGDIASLEWACFSKKGKLIVWTDKRDRRVELDIDDHLFEGISSIPSNNRKVCFPEQDEIARSKKRYKLSVQFMRILQAVGIHGKSFHCLRHTYATECDLNGIPTPHISERLGHTDRKTTEGYIH